MASEDLDLEIEGKITANIDEIIRHHEKHIQAIKEGISLWEEEVNHLCSFFFFFCNW